MKISNFISKELVFIDVEADTIDGLIEDVLNRASVVDEELGKNLKKHNLFESRHKIVLKDGTEITTLKEWNKEVDKQLNKIYSNEPL